VSGTWTTLINTGVVTGGAADGSCDAPHALHVTSVLVTCYICRWLHRVFDGAVTAAGHRIENVEATPKHEESPQKD
jgi:hypothetical protein